MINFWKMAYEAVKKQRDDYKAQRDTLIDDIAVLRANNERLERENRFLLSRKDNLFDSWRDENKRSVTLSKKLEQLKRENEKLKATNENLNNRVRNLNLNGQIQHDELMSCDGEVRYWKDKYTTLTNHIRDMKFASPYSYNYIHLVNFIKELEHK
ncbi:hypothetical protein BJG88_10350 [Staphylococcus nepalensis]|uniref:hypothetical protein n=1 Tax=Staphylococcus nepalensis TaxID=214473 RepID=UPI000D58A7BC|nr:hypothetical protein [Staphylococcus nepalensis]AWI45113.1 hypothetical protein BJG88_10350 [Staphylococcus nepalensis]